MPLTLLESPAAFDLIVSPFEAALLRDALAVIHPDSGAAIAAAARMEAQLTGGLDLAEARAARRAGGGS